MQGKLRNRTMLHQNGTVQNVVPRGNCLVQTFQRFRRNKTALHAAMQKKVDLGSAYLLPFFDFVPALLHRTCWKYDWGPLISQGLHWIFFPR